MTAIVVFRLWMVPIIRSAIIDDVGLQIMYEFFDHG
ncbi:MAG: hypothetical protein ACI8RD_011579, partial [Bacillariaceae sp.]